VRLIVISPVAASVVSTAKLTAVVESGLRRYCAVQLVQPAVTRFIASSSSLKVKVWLKVSPAYTLNVPTLVGKAIITLTSGARISTL
jgi:hypothetical protein